MIHFLYITRNINCISSFNFQTTPNVRNNIRHAQHEDAATQDTEDSDSENESSIFTLGTIIYLAVE